MIMCRWDTNGVANELLGTSKHEQEEIDQVLHILQQLHTQYGDFDIVDGGANVGCWTLQLAKACTGWGTVYSFEPQKRLYHALVGNVALNNCHNVTPCLAALTEVSRQVSVPQLPVDRPANYSTLQLENPPGGSDPREIVAGMTIDSLKAPIRLMKLDIEGMEYKALQGAEETIKLWRPVIFAEVWMSGSLSALLPRYNETRVSHDKRNAIYVPEEYNINVNL
jgi:FkbM family methyltransferase